MIGPPLEALTRVAYHDGDWRSLVTTLWADVPPDLRTRFPYPRPPEYPSTWTPSCPYAVRADRVLGYRPGPHEMRRCFGLSRPGLPCASHDSLGPRRSSQMGRLRNTISRAMPSPEPTDQLRWFRALPDDALEALRNVGTATVAAFREARDTWDDERVMAFFRFEPAPVIPPPEAFWAARPDVFNVVGG